MDDEEPCYALKCIDMNEQPNLSPDGKQRAVREAQALLKLQHPNVARYHKAFLSEGRLCYMTEFADQTLHHLIYTMKERQQRLSEDLTWHLFIQICHGLKKLHDSAIIHRALKVRAPPAALPSPRAPPPPPRSPSVSVAPRRTRVARQARNLLLLAENLYADPVFKYRCKLTDLGIPELRRGGSERAPCPSEDGAPPHAPPGVGHRGLRPPLR
jgi:serine/threonine protein kinase